MHDAGQRLHQVRQYRMRGQGRNDACWFQRIAGESGCTPRMRRLDTPGPGKGSRAPPRSTRNGRKAPSWPPPPGLPGPYPVTPGPSASTEPRKLVPERRRNLEHPWMSAPPEHLHVPVPQVVAARIRTSNSPSRGVGTGSSRISICSGPSRYMTRCFMRMEEVWRAASNGLTLMRGERQTKVRRTAARAGRAPCLKGRKGVLL